MTPPSEAAALRLYPIQDGPSVPWIVMLAHESQSQKNHSQSVTRIAERGGYGAAEAWCIVNDIGFFEGEKKWGGHVRMKELWHEFADKTNREYALAQPSAPAERDVPALTLERRIRELIAKWRSEATAHTYTSVNPDQSRGFDAGRRRSTNELEALLAAPRAEKL